MGVETLSFEEALEKEQERLYQEKNELLSNEHYRSFSYQHYSYLSRGVYIDQIQAWRQYYPQESMVILASEEFYSNPTKIISQMIDIFGLTNKEITDTVRYRESPHQSMDSNTRKRLAAYFRPHNLKLFEYLDMDLGWENYRV